MLNQNHSHEEFGEVQAYILDTELVNHTFLLMVVMVAVHKNLSVSFMGEKDQNTIGNNVNMS